MKLLRWQGAIPIVAVLALILGFVYLFLDNLIKRTVETTGSEQLQTQIGMNWLASQQYRGQILEFFAPGSGKWQALRRVADTAGIAPEQIAAVGDDNNDVGMIRGAGFGIAMGNAVAAAKAAADTVVGSNAEAGVVEAIELVLAER